MGLEMTPGQLASRLEKGAASLFAGSLSVPLKKSLITAKRWTRKNFEESHSPDGVPWSPLAHARPSGRGGDKPLRDKGALLASVTAAGNATGHIESIDQFGFTMGTNLEYAALQHHGGTVVPRNAKALAIPLSKEAARYDSPRFFPRPLAFVARGGKPPLLIETVARGKGKGRKDVKSIVHYILVQKVVVPARPFLGFNEPMLQEIEQIFLEDLERRTLGVVGR